MIFKTNDEFKLQYRFKTLNYAIVRSNEHESITTQVDTSDLSKMSYTLCDFRFE